MLKPYLICLPLILLPMVAKADHYQLAKRSLELAHNLGELALLEANSFCQSQIHRSSAESDYAGHLYADEEYYAAREMMRSAALDLAYTRLKDCQQVGKIQEYFIVAGKIIEDTRPDPKE